MYFTEMVHEEKRLHDIILRKMPDIFIHWCFRKIKIINMSNESEGWKDQLLNILV